MMTDYMINGIIVAYVSGDELYISRSWARDAGIKTIKIAEGTFGIMEHRI